MKNISFDKGLNKEVQEKATSQDMAVSRDPNYSVSPTIETDPFLMPVEDIFYIEGRGIVLTGQIISGIVCIGDPVVIIGSDNYIIGKVKGVEMFRKLLDRGEEGDNIGLLITTTNNTKEDFNPGMFVCHTKNMK